MKILLGLLVVAFTAVLAQVGDFAANGRDLQNLSVEDEFEGLLLDDGQIDDYNEETFSQVALSIIRTGRPNCLSPNNWGRRFRHNWYITRFWECNRWRTDLRACAIPRLYQPSLEHCVWAWNWRWEPIRRPEETPPTLPPGTLDPGLTPPTTTPGLWPDLTPPGLTSPPTTTPGLLPDLTTSAGPTSHPTTRPGLWPDLTSPPGLTSSPATPSLLPDLTQPPEQMSQSKIQSNNSHPELAPPSSK